MPDEVKKSQLIKLLRLVRPNLGFYLMSAIGLAATEASIYIVIAFVLKQMMSAAVNQSVRVLQSAIVLLCVTAVMVSLLFVVFEYMMGCCVAKTITNIRSSIFDHLEKIQIEYVEANHSGSIVSILTNDIGAVERLYKHNINRLIYALVYGISSIAAMAVLDWRVALILIAVSLCLSLIYIQFSRALRFISRKNQNVLSVLSEHLLNLICGLSVIKILHMGEVIGKKYYAANDEFKTISLSKGRKSAAMESVNYLLNVFSFGGVVAVGTILVSRKLTDFATVMAMAQLITGAIYLFSGIGSIFAQMQGSLAGADRIFNFLEAPEENYSLQASVDKSCEETETDNAMIAFEGVSFCYQGENKVLNDLNFRIKPGQTAAFVGASGSGKSTVAKLLLGFYPVNKGKIIINGKYSSSCSLKQIRELIAYVPQNPFLFDGTIEDNIRFGRLDATQEDIIAAAKAANAHEFIIEKPEGYKSRIGEKAVNLSGGQKQRIAIARALIKGSPILILDEATSSLDNNAEFIIQSGLANIAQERTVIIIAHRLSTIEDADIIYVMDEGKIVEEGSHSQLMQEAGVYKYLSEMQA